MAVLENFRLDGRVALVTGAARGLGRAMAVGLAEAGADVAALDILPVDETQGEISTLGRRCHPMTNDLRVTKAAEAAAIVEECVSALGRLDILVNNAGLIRRSPALDFPEDDWEDVIAINISAVLLLIKAAALHFVDEV